MKLRGGEVAVVRGKDGRFRVTIPKDLALALGLEGGERGKIQTFTAFFNPGGSVVGDHPEEREGGRG
jgi:hypothetical protein